MVAVRQRKQRRPVRPTDVLVLANDVWHDLAVRHARGHDAQKVAAARPQRTIPCLRRGGLLEVAVAEPHQDVSILRGSAKSQYHTQQLRAPRVDQLVEQSVVQPTDDLRLYALVI